MTWSDTVARSDAGIGDTIRLDGISAGESLAITLTKVSDPAGPVDEFSAPSAGNRLVGVQFRIANAGSVSYDDDVLLDVDIVDVQGQTYQPALADSIKAGPSLDEVHIAPGDSRLGYVVFEVPDSATLGQVQFVPDAGVADTTAEWSLAAAAQPAPRPAPQPTRHANPPAQSPSEVVGAYFDAINAKDYQRAWDLGGKNLGKPYGTFVSGFSDTQFDTVTIDGTSGDVVSVSLDAEQNDGSVRSFSGTFTVHDGVISRAHLTRQ